RHTSTHGQKMVAHFFFSSRRRHTRFSRDWSSDVCSSDLVETDIASEFRYRAPVMAPGGLALFISQSGETADTLAALKWAKSQGQIGRAACRERVKVAAVGARTTKNRRMEARRARGADKRP